eukprot:TRINITY_DN4087_c0_g1_i1.p1 TRINITY_DN4087_c0_g1~~TRINITY_DN4087_c0_g1_i1.p1  ORF type:complete len:626 (-),score=62.50 TRINITY_DN4087_c0_g1_i1:129-2006(-)
MADGPSEASRRAKSSQAWNVDSSSFIPGSSRLISSPMVPPKSNYGNYQPSQQDYSYSQPHFSMNPNSGTSSLNSMMSNMSLQQGAQMNQYYNQPQYGMEEYPPMRASSPQPNVNKSPKKSMSGYGSSSYDSYYPQQVQSPQVLNQGVHRQAGFQSSSSGGYYGAAQHSPATAPRNNNRQNVNIPQQQYRYPPSTLPHQVLVQPGRRSVQSFFMSDNLRHEIQHKNSLLLRGTSQDEPVVVNLPPLLAQYHSFYPLEGPRQIGATSKAFRVPTATYKCQSIHDGLPYALRKVDIPMRANMDFAMQIAEMWKQIQHSGIIALRDVFRSGSSLFFAYDYHPASETLESRFINQSSGYIQEDILWSIIVQLCSAIQCIHRHRQCCRSILSASKILYTGKNRVRLNCVGLEDIVNPSNGKSLQIDQYHDLMSLGKLIVNLACKSNDAMSKFAQSMEHISSTYSEQFNELIILLCNKPNSYPTIDDIIQRIQGRVMDQVDRLNCYNDSLEAELSKELENGRLFRLLAKLGFINERPEYDMSTSWSETGDRYLLKLFRDHVFHQVYEDGSPVLDFAHVVESLNKLDLGIPENVLLTSRNEQSMIIVGYNDLKRIVSEAFQELLSKQALSENK